jgi:hypothetical protein
MIVDAELWISPPGRDKSQWVQRTTAIGSSHSRSVEQRIHNGFKELMADYPCKTIPMISRLLQNKDLEQLRKMQQQNISNALYGIRFGSHNVSSVDSRHLMQYEPHMYISTQK